MKTKPMPMRKKQGGAILVVALMFLVAITLYTISSMRSSNSCQPRFDARGGRYRVHRMHCRRDWLQP
jgi:Tfp pilus assembly protein PilX